MCVEIALALAGFALLVAAVWSAVVTLSPAGWDRFGGQNEQR